MRVQRVDPSIKYTVMWTSIVRIVKTIAWTTGLVIFGVFGVPSIVPHSPAPRPDSASRLGSGSRLPPTLPL